MRIAKTLALVLALIVPLAAVGARPAEAAASVSVGVFYNSLAPYGDWHVSADFGYVWRPTTVYAGWRPYHDGRWVNTNVGWTFVGNDAWGWATYHYGRWYFDPYYGWVWVPGYEWGPAWVSFHEGPGYIGWAPLSPYVTFGVGVYGGGYGGHYIDPRGYNFVESRHFLSPTVGRWVQPIDRNVSLVRNVRDVSRFDRVGGMMVNRGLAVDRVERATRSRVRTFQIADHPGGGRALRSEIRGEQLAVYRPKVEKRSTDRPAKVKEGRPAKFDDGRGRSSVEKRESPAREASPSRATTPTTRSTTPVAKPVKPSTSSRDDKRVASPPSRSSASTVTRKPAAAPQQAPKVSKSTPDRKVAATQPPSKVSKSTPDRKVAATQPPSKASKSTPDRKVSAPQQPSKSKPAPEKKVSTPTRERTVSPPPQRKESKPEQKAQSAPKGQDPKSAQVRSKSTAEQQKAEQAKADKAKQTKGGKTTTKKPSEKRKPPLLG